MLRRSALSRLCLIACCGFGLVIACTGESDDPYAVVEDWECFETVALSDGGAGGGSGEALGGAGGVDSPVPAEQPACECFGVEAGRELSDPRPRVNRCGASVGDTSGWQCCYAFPNDVGSFDCRCEDAPADEQVAAYCASEAALRQGEVVERCPPTPLDNATYCAFRGESCDPEYLDDHALSGCCENLVCRPDAQGVPVCVAK